MVFESARGPLKSLAERVAGEPIRGSWWSHPASHEIFAAIETVRKSPAVVATRLVNSKVTLIHRRLWPAVVRIADQLPTERLAALHEEHTLSGAHRTIEVRFPYWVPDEIQMDAKRLTVGAAFNFELAVVEHRPQSSGLSLYATDTLSRPRIELEFIQQQPTVAEPVGNHRGRRQFRLNLKSVGRLDGRSSLSDRERREHETPDNTCARSMIAGASVAICQSSATVMAALDRRFDLGKQRRHHRELAGFAWQGCAAVELDCGSVLSRSDPHSLAATARTVSSSVMVR
jgi:hypothetical protein